MAIESIINLNIAKRLRENDEFRKEYFRTRSRNEIATQLISLRKKRRMTQKSLAEAIQTGQSAISRMEKADYASWNNQTLEGIAEALGARWRHVLEPVENVIRQYEYDEQQLHADQTGTTTFVGIDEEGTDFEPIEGQPVDDLTTVLADTKPVVTGNATYRYD